MSTTQETIDIAKKIIEKNNRFFNVTKEENTASSLDFYHKTKLLKRHKDDLISFFNAIDEQSVLDDYIDKFWSVLNGAKDNGEEFNLEKKWVFGCYEDVLEYQPLAQFIIKNETHLALRFWNNGKGIANEPLINIHFSSKQRDEIEYYRNKLIRYRYKEEVCELDETLAKFNLLKRKFLLGELEKKEFLDEGYKAHRVIQDMQQLIQSSKQQQLKNSGLYQLLDIAYEDKKTLVKRLTKITVCEKNLELNPAWKRINDEIKKLDNKIEQLTKIRDDFISLEDKANNPSVDCIRENLINLASPEFRNTIKIAFASLELYNLSIVNRQKPPVEIQFIFSPLLQSKFWLNCVEKMTDEVKMHIMNLESLIDLDYCSKNEVKNLIDLRKNFEIDNKNFISQSKKHHLAIELVNHISKLEKQSHLAENEKEGVKIRLSYILSSNLLKQLNKLNRKKNELNSREDFEVAKTVANLSLSLKQGMVDYICKKDDMNFFSNMKSELISAKNSDLATHRNIFTFIFNIFALVLNFITFGITPIIETDSVKQLDELSSLINTMEKNQPTFN